MSVKIMSSIFDIEEKSNKEVDEDYLVSNGWKLVCVNFFGWVYMKNIRHKNRPSRFIKFYYHLNSFPKRTLRNMNTRDVFKVHDIMTLELQVNEWITDWENNATPLYLFEYF